MPVYKTANKTKDGRVWFFTISYKDIQGNQRRFKSKKYATKREAEEEEATYKVKVKDPQGKSIKFEELYLRYIDRTKKKNKESTMYAKESVSRLYILPYFGNKYINVITIHDIQKWHNEIEKYGFSLRYKQKMHEIISSVLNLGIKMLLIDRNVAQVNGNFQSSNDEVITDEEKIRYITPEEFNLFISVVDDIVYKSFFMFLYYMGCRKGEAQAITWNDIDFDSNMVKINKTLTVKTKTDTYKLTNTKNRKNRTIQMPKRLSDQMKELYNHYSKYKNFEKSWLVFGGIRHLPQTSIDKHKSRYYNLVDELIKPNKFNRITCHEFRHSAASLLISKNIPVPLIAERIGDTVEVVLNVYAHLFPNTQQEIVDILNNLDKK